MKINTHRSIFTYYTLLAAFLLMSFDNCNCWWNEGHMIVANIAKKDLLAKDPQAYYIFNNITEVMKNDRHGKINNLVESSTWPDIVKTYHLHMMDSWHFRDIAVNYSDPNPPKIDHYVENNALYFIENSFHSLVDWTYDQAMNIDTQFEKSFLLSYMIHIVGDIHQPLHACALVNKNFPTGDMGGNLFFIKVDNPQIKNLHSIWDSVLGRVKEGLDLPLNEDDEQLVDKYADDLMNEFPKKEMDSELDDDFYFHDWIKESWKLCRDFVYKDIKVNDKLSEEYIEEAYKIAKHRMALAGYRISNMLYESYQGYIKAIKGGPSGPFNDEKVTSKNIHSKEVESLKFLGQ